VETEARGRRETGDREHRGAETPEAAGFLHRGKHLSVKRQTPRPHSGAGSREARSA
jgi:hypothetical protein